MSAGDAATRSSGERRGSAHEHPAEPGQDAAMGDLALAWVKDIGVGLGTSFRLAIAEAKLAAMSLVLMLFLTVLAAIFAIGAWGLFLTALVIALQQWGVPLWAALLGLGVAQILAALGLFHAVSRLGRRLELVETNRQLEAFMDNGDSDDDD